jgi:8-oxo-dGTP pyrophosphatase MutT (NUDIX family)
MMRLMRRRQYLSDPHAPVPHGLLLAAFAAVRNHCDDVLLVLRADDGNWELPGGRLEVGESAAAAAVREVSEEAGISVKITALAGVYSTPAHVLFYPEEGTYQQVAICFHARALQGEAPRPDMHETTAAEWFSPRATAILPMHPTMRERLTDALREPHGDPHFD